MKSCACTLMGANMCDTNSVTPGNVSAHQCHDVNLQERKHWLCIALRDACFATQAAIEEKRHPVLAIREQRWPMPLFGLARKAMHALRACTSGVTHPVRNCYHEVNKRTMPMVCIRFCSSQTCFFVNAALLRALRMQILVHRWRRTVLPHSRGK